MAEEQAIVAGERFSGVQDLICELHGVISTHGRL